MSSSHHGSDDREGGDIARDAHLRTALHHAPDHDAAPPPALSAAILAQARAAAQPSPAPRPAPARPPGLIERFLTHLSRPAFAGAFGSVLIAGVITVMWQDGPPPEALPGGERSPAASREASKAAPPAPPAPPAAFPAAPGVMADARAPAPAAAPRADTAAKAMGPAESRTRVVTAVPPLATPQVATHPAQAPAAAPIGRADGPQAAAERDGPHEPTMAKSSAGATPAVTMPAPASPAPPPAAGPAAAPAAAPPMLAAAPAPVPAQLGGTTDRLRESATDNLATGAGRLERAAPATQAAVRRPQAVVGSDPLAAAIAALASAAADDPRSRSEHELLLSLRRSLRGPWVAAPPIAADAGRNILAPDGSLLGRLRVDDQSVTWQPAGGPAWTAPRTSPPASGGRP